MENKIKQLLGEMHFAIITLQLQLETANNKIMELTTIPTNNTEVKE